MSPKKNSRLNVVSYDASLQRLASTFNSRNSYLDNFLRESRSLDDGFGKTYVLLSEDDSNIIRYYNIGVGYIEQIRGRARVKIGGSAHINCFALDEEYHGLLQNITADGVQINLSDVLLDDCIRRICNIRDNHIGFAFITLCSTEQGYNLYKRNDFEELEGDMNFSADENDYDCFSMYLPLDIE